MKKAILLGTLLALLLLYMPEAWASQWTIGILVPKAENQSGFPVWRNRFDPSDPLPTETAETFATLLRRFPSLEVYSPESKTTSDEVDLTAELTLHELRRIKSDVLGSQMKGRALVRLVAYDGRGNFLFSRVAEKQIDRWTPEFKAEPQGHFTWDEFERSPYWAACKVAIEELCDLFLNGASEMLELEGRIVRIMPQESGGGDRYLVNIGMAKGLREKGKLDAYRVQEIYAKEGTTVKIPSRIAVVEVVSLSEDWAIVETVSVAEGESLAVSDIVRPRLR